MFNGCKPRVQVRRRFLRAVKAHLGVLVLVAETIKQVLKRHHACLFCRLYESVCTLIASALWPASTRPNAAMICTV